MRRLSLALALVPLLYAAPAGAQGRRERDDGWFTRQGDFALAFSIDALTVRPVAGGVGGRYWLSDRAVAAASLGFGLATIDGPYGDDTDAFTTSFSVGFERHFGHRRRVSPFAGAVAQVAHAEADFGDVYYSPESPCVPEEPCPVPGGGMPYPYTQTLSETAFGLAALLGAEIRVADGVTVMLAHRLGLTYVRGDGGAAVYPQGPPACEACEGGIPVGGRYRNDYRRVELGTGTTALTLSVYL